MTSNTFRELARQGPREAPPSVERALLREFRLRKSKRLVVKCAVAIAAVVLVAIFIPRPQPIPPPQPRLAHIAVPRWDRPPGLSISPRKRRASKPLPTEVATRFYPLQDAANLPPFEYGSIVRVELPRSALRAVGLPVNENRLSERIDADILLGQDGLARAVRFVQ